MVDFIGMPYVEPIVQYKILTMTQKKYEVKKVVKKKATKKVTKKTKKK